MPTRSSSTPIWRSTLVACVLLGFGFIATSPTMPPTLRLAGVLAAACGVLVLAAAIVWTIRELRKP